MPVDSEKCQQNNEQVHTTTEAALTNLVFLCDISVSYTINEISLHLNLKPRRRRLKPKLSGGCACQDRSNNHHVNAEHQFNTQ